MSAKGRETITQIEAQESSLEVLHGRIQKTLVRFVAPGGTIVLGALALFDPCWQNTAMFAGFVTASVCWVIAQFFSKQRNMRASVLILITSTIFMNTLGTALIEGGSPLQLLGGALIIIYASFFSKNHLYGAVGLVMLGFILSQFAIHFELYPLIEISPAQTLAFEIPIAVLLLSASAFFLRSFRKMNEQLISSGTDTNARLTEVIQTALGIGSVLEGVVAKIKTASDSFVSKAGEQAASLKEMNNSIDHIRQAASNTANVATETRTMTAAFQNKSAKGSEQIKKMLEEFQKVVEINETAKAEFAELVTHADAIENVLHTNREIATQIKILATNAGIQASKVGKLGRGFRVVANELKAMIQRTDESLNHSRDILENIRVQTEKSRAILETSSSLVKNQYTQLTASGDLVHEIARTFVDMANKVEQIAHDAKGQHIRLDEVASGINYLDFTAQELTNSTEVLADSIDQIAKSNRTITDTLDA